MYSPLYAIILLLETELIAPGLVEVSSRLLMHAKYSFYTECAMATGLHNVYQCWKFYTQLLHQRHTNKPGSGAKQKQ